MVVQGPLSPLWGILELSIDISILSQLELEVILSFLLVSMQKPLPLPVGLPSSGSILRVGDILKWSLVR
jgi:hypothetical protein